VTELDGLSVDKNDDLYVVGWNPVVFGMLLMNGLGAVVSFSGCD
jgi:hypothetical protein